MKRTKVKEMKRVEMKRVEGAFVKGANVRRSVEAWDGGSARGGTGRGAEVWVSSGVPPVVRNDGWMAVGSTLLTDVGKRVIWMEKGDMLGYGLEAATGGWEQMAVTSLGTVKGRWLRAESAGEGVLRVELEGARSVYAGYDGEGTMVALWGELPEMPWLGFGVGEERTFSEPLRRVALSGGSNLQTHSLLCEEDCRRIALESVAAYTRVRLRGEGQGFQMQPRMVRYRLVDGGGGTLVCGPWVLLAGSMGVQLTGDLTASSTDSLASMTGGVVQLRGFKVAVPSLPSLPTPWNRVVKRVEVEWGRVIDPVDPQGIGSAFGSSNGQSVAITFRLPTRTTEELRRMVTDAVGATLLSDAPHPVRDAVSHRAVAECGGRVLRGGERVEPFHGYGLPALTVRGGTAQWQGIVEVTLGGGRTAVWSGNGLNGSPEQLSGLLWYPDPSAREMRVTLRKGSSVVQETYTLTPSPCGRFAYYLTPSWTLLTPASTIGAMPLAPVSQAVGSERRGVVKVMEGERVVDSATIDPAGITAIAGASRSRSGWDFSRARALVFGRSGSRLLVMDGKGRIHSVGELDRRSVATSRSVAEISSDRGLTHIVAAGGDLLEVGNNRVDTILRGCNAVEVGWCGRWREYWWCTPEGRVMRCSADRPAEWVEVKSAALSGTPRLRMWEGELLVGSTLGSGVCMARGESYPTEGAVMEITQRAREAMLPAGVHPVTFHLSGASLRGSVGLWGDRATGVAEKLLALELNGSVNAPLRAMMAAPGRLSAETRVALTVTAPTRWGGVAVGR